MDIKKIQKNIAPIGIILFFAGLIFSKVLLSISILIIFLSVFFTHSFSEILKEILKDKILISFILLFAVVLLGGIYSNNTDNYLDDVVLKLPFLLLPFGLLSSEIYKKKNLIFFLLALQLFVFISGSASFINYILHKKEFDALIFQAKPIPIVTDINHIYFSFILAFSTISTAIISLCHIKNKNLKIILWITVILNIVFLHVIAARTGLAGFYASVFALIIFWGLKNKKHFLSLGFIVVILLLAFLSLTYVDSLNNRLQKTIEDIETNKNNGDINHYSISMRFEYWEKSFKVFLKSPIIGVSKADVKEEMKIIFKKENTILEEVNQKGPHNQFLQILAGTGILGFLIFAFIFFYPLIKIFKTWDFIFLSFWVVMFIAFMVESVLERQWGISFFTLLMIIFIRSDKLLNDESKNYNEQQ